MAYFKGGRLASVAILLLLGAVTHLYTGSPTCGEFMTSAAIATPTRRRVGIRNSYLSIGSLFLGAVGLGNFVTRWNSPSGWLGLALGAFCVWLFIIELRGVTVDRGMLSFPRRPLRWLPIFSIWRQQIATIELHEMTVLPRWYGLQVVLVEGAFGAERLLFQSRSVRMKFFEAVKAQAPGIRIYRAS